MNHARPSRRRAAIVVLILSALAILTGTSPAPAATPATPSRLDVVVAIDNSQRLDGPRYTASRRAAITLLSALPTDAPPPTTSSSPRARTAKTRA